MRSVPAAICLAFTLQFCAAGGALALSAKDVPLPRPKPESQKREVLSSTDVSLYREVFEDIRHHRWDDARRKARQGSEPVARKLVDWMYYREQGNTASFREIAAFLKDNPDWPSREALQSRAEERMPPGLDPQEVVDWFGNREPRTGRGRKRLGEALIAQGKYKAGRDMVREAWAQGDFTTSEEREFIAIHGDLLRETDADIRRLDRLLWEHKHTAARRQMRRVGADWRALAEARIALRSVSRGVDRAVAQVPAALADHPGLQYERARWRRRKGRHEETWPILAEVHKAGEELGDPEKWWEERHAQVRRVLGSGKHQMAYDMVAYHGLKGGTSYSEAEWLAGWIALRYLNRPPEALAHFKRLQDNVSTPISLARAHFWQGRAAEAMNDALARKNHYAEAAKHNMTFYGQLAAERLYGKDAYLQLPAEAPRNPSDASGFEKRELIRVLKILHDIGQDRWIRSISNHLAGEYKSAEELYRLSSMLMDLGYPHFAVQTGKSALHRGMLIVQTTYPLQRFQPVHDLKSPPEPAIVLGLSRQETEFYTKAVSHAGAHGLMQLLPGTARATARRHGLPFQREWLTERPAYNLTLGQAHFAELLEEFNGSYIMAAAAYNAGSSRVRRWIRDFGDPRARNVDPIDWIEMIPFSETRNYVQRVMENTLVYRTLLAGKPVQIVLSQDLKRGGGPDPKPLQRDAPAIAPLPKQQAVADFIEQAKPPKPSREEVLPPGSSGGAAGVRTRARDRRPAAPARAPAVASTTPEAAHRTAAGTSPPPPAAANAATDVSSANGAVLAADWPRELFAVMDHGDATGVTGTGASDARRVMTVAPQASTRAEIFAYPAGSAHPWTLVSDTAEQWPVPAGCKRYLVEDDGGGVCVQR